MASRRQGKDRSGPFGAEQAQPSAITLEQADRGIYGDRLAEMTSGRVVDVTELVISGQIQPRAGGLDQARVEMLAEVILNGGEYKDPLDVFEISEGITSGLYVAGGFHRHEAYKRALERAKSEDRAGELKPLRARIHHGTLDEAIEFAEEDNLQHGQPLTDADRRGIYERRVQRGHRWASMSNRAVAAALGVSHVTVGRWRKEIENESPVTNVTGDQSRIGADGKTYDTTNIRKAAALRAARQALEKLDLPDIDAETYERIRPTLNDSIDYVKGAAGFGNYKDGRPGTLRDFLPYALAIELDTPPFEEPRISLVEWFRSQLPAWQAERDADAAAEASVAQARDRILAILATGPRRDVLALIKEFSDEAKETAFAQLRAEGLIARDSEYTFVVQSPDLAGGDQEERDAVDVVRESILAALCGGAKGPAELKYELGAVSDVIYQVARDSLLQEGLIVRDKDLHSGRVTYRAANVSDDCDAAPAAPAPVEPVEQGFKWQGVETAKTALLIALQDGPLKAHDLRAAVEAQGVGYQPHLDARNQLEAAGRIVYELVDGSATYRLASQAAAPTLPPGVTLDRLGTDAHSSDHDVELEQAYRTLAQLEKAALDVRDAIAALHVVKSIRTLYRVGPERLDQLDALLATTWDKLMDAPEHVEDLRMKLVVMRQTGAPYEE